MIRIFMLMECKLSVKKGAFLTSGQRISKTSSLDESIRLPSRIFVGANVQMRGRVLLSEELWIEPNVIVYGPAELGGESYIGSNSVIGFPDRNELQDIISGKNMEGKLKKGAIVRLGNKVLIRSNCVIYSGVDVGNGVCFGHNVMIRENVKIGDGSLVGTNSVIDGNCKIGHNVSIQTGVYVSTYTTIKDRVFLGPRCVLINDRYLAQKETQLIGPTIQQGASIGANAVILPGVTVGEGAIVGAGAVVVDNVPPTTIVVGVPAKKLRDVPPNWRIKLK